MVMVVMVVMMVMMVTGMLFVLRMAVFLVTMLAYRFQLERNVSDSML